MSHAPAAGPSLVSSPAANGDGATFFSTGGLGDALLVVALRAWRRRWPARVRLCRCRFAATGFNSKAPWVQ